jgi:hypothetical protein
MRSPGLDRFAAPVAAALIAAGSASPAVGAMARTGVFTYSIHNERFGDVGIYTNTIRREGDAIVVRNRTDIAVKFFSMTMYYLVAKSTAVWEDGRLVRFDSDTDDDGRVFKVRARREGGRLAIEGALGRSVVPGGIYPHNPWSMGIRSAGAIMSPKSGRLFPAKVSNPRHEEIAHAGETRRTTTFQIDTDRRTWVWYDEGGIPIKFVMERKRGRELLTFTLTKIE